VRGAVAVSGWSLWVGGERGEERLRFQNERRQDGDPFLGGRPAISFVSGLPCPFSAGASVGDKDEEVLFKTQGAVQWRAAGESEGIFLRGASELLIGHAGFPCGTHVWRCLGRDVASLVEFS
jgi:hypothetical protein